MAKEKFEEAMKRLEDIVEKMESGDLPLEGSLKLFEEGIRLSRFCGKKLEEAQKKVEILLSQEDGSLATRPFSLDLEKEDETESGGL
jgi:exodeoxyribonuclease VII small subunit